MLAPRNYGWGPPPMPDNAGPRARLAVVGPGALEDRDLLAIVLGRGPRSVELAGALLAASGGLARLGQASVRRLEQVPGIGPARAAAVVAALELGRRAAAQPLRTGEPLRSAAHVHEHFAPRLAHLEREVFCALLLDGKHRVLREVLISEGSLTATLVHPREVFRPAIEEGAAAIVVVHNHPSGDPTPSAEDRAITRRLREAGELLGIRLLDHLVVGRGAYVSLAEW